MSKDLYLDLRSDTVSRPTPELREYMMGAPVDDDAYGTDPTVLRLEAEMAARTGKEAAMFVPSGTMANEVAVQVHTRPGQTLACAPQAHVLVHEDGGPARHSGVQCMTLGTREAGYGAAELRALMAEEACGWPRVGLVWTENTLGAAGGRIWPLERLQALKEAAGDRPVHLDGARIWNAVVATGIDLERWASTADSISCCFSKGLGAPAGSVLCGPADFIEQARQVRHAFGGTMRQTGLLAEAARYVVEHNVERLAEDHRRARALSEALGALPCWRAMPVDTNMAVFEVEAPFEHAEQMCLFLRREQILVYPNTYREVRMVTHLGITDDDVREIVDRSTVILKRLKPEHYEQLMAHEAAKPY